SGGGRIGDRPAPPFARACPCFSWAWASRPDAANQPQRAPMPSAAAAARVDRVRMVSSPRSDRRSGLIVPARPDSVEALLQFNRYRLDLAGELERHVVVEVDRRARVLTDVEPLVQRDPDRVGPLESPLGDLRAVYG